MTAEDYGAWIGRSRTSEEVIDAGPRDRLAATLGIEPNGDTLPVCWHWLYHLDKAPRDRIREDGHAITGDFLPPIPARRRMFAGTRLSFHRPVRVGAATTQRQTVTRIEKKSGRQGDIWLISVSLELLEGADLLVEEQKTIVLLQTLGGPRSGAPSEMVPDWSEDEMVDEVLLFRYSALTFNAHRIHYDREYATRVEGYPERVVHGPLQATLLAMKAEMWGGAPLRSFTFRGVAPAFVDDTLTLCGRGQEDGRLQLEIRAQDGIATTTAQAELAVGR